MKNPVTHGLHHITAMSGEPHETRKFYTDILGLRMVKKSVNQDSPDTYHLFFADADGNPGTDITFFPWPSLPQARDGYGIVSETAFAVPTGSLNFWKERLEANDIEIYESGKRFGEDTIRFFDYHGMQVAITETENPRDTAIWKDSSVPAEHQLRGFHTARLQLYDTQPTDFLLTRYMGFTKVEEEDGWIRYESGKGGSGTLIDIKAFPDWQPARGGKGGVHHVAFRTKDRDVSEALRNEVKKAGLNPSPVIDRFWFESVYFREPNGVLFELATDGPGFDRDEDPAHLGEKLILPPWLETQRAEIEANLPDID